MEVETITLKKLSEITGYSQGALRQKIYRGELVKGKHYIHGPDGRVHIIVSEWNQWVRSGKKRCKTS